MCKVVGGQGEELLIMIYYMNKKQVLVFFFINGEWLFLSWGGSLVSKSTLCLCRGSMLNISTHMLAQNSQVSKSRVSDSLF